MELHEVRAAANGQTRKRRDRQLLFSRGTCGRRRRAWDLSGHREACPTASYWQSHSLQRSQSQLFRSFLISEAPQLLSNFPLFVVSFGLALESAGLILRSARGFAYQESVSADRALGCFRRDAMELVGEADGSQGSGTSTPVNGAQTEIACFARGECRDRTFLALARRVFDHDATNSLAGWRDRNNRGASTTKPRRCSSLYRSIRR
jgi:hypothetical protein